MAKISNTSAYPNITPQASDYLVLTDTSDSNATKTVTVQALADFISVGNVTLQEVLDAGNTATENINLTGNYNGTGNITLTGTGNLTMSGDLTVSGSTNLIGSAVGTTSFNGDVQLLGNLGQNLNFLSPANIALGGNEGNNGDVLTSGGAGSAMSWSAPLSLLSLPATNIYIGSSVAPNIGKPVASSLIAVDDSNPALPNYDITIGNPTPTQTLIQGLFYANVVHPYGTNNLQYGEESLLGPTGENNTAIGLEALRNTSTGESNTAVGGLAMTNNLGGNKNVAVGYGSLTNNTLGDDNSAVGESSLQQNTSGGFNTGIGADAGRTNNGNSNVFVGHRSGSALSGDENVTIGARALGASTGASTRNVAIGYIAGESAATAVEDNVIIGHDAGFAVQGDGNTIIGKGAGRVSQSNNTIIGSGAAPLANFVAGTTTCVGTGSLAQVTSGRQNVAMGTRAGDILDTGGRNVFVGERANCVNGGDDNVTAIGDNAIATDSSIALGSSSQAPVINAIALGKQAVANNSNTININVSGAPGPVVNGGLVATPVGTPLPPAGVGPGDMYVVTGVQFPGSPAGVICDVVCIA